MYPVGYFSNSTLQCLFNLPAFNTYFLSGKYQNDMRGYCKVADSYAKLLNLVRNTVSTSESPSTLKSAVASRNYQFGGYKQQDANEFLVCLLEFMGEDLKLDYKSAYRPAGSSTILERVRALLLRARSAGKSTWRETTPTSTRFLGGSTSRPSPAVAATRFLTGSTPSGIFSWPSARIGLWMTWSICSKSSQKERS